MKTPITLIAGALGSGKTTLVRELLKVCNRKIAVLMNEFGEVAIDSKIIQGQNIDIIELAGGCVCCSLTGELQAAVEELIETVHPELIVLEATGVAEADALVYEVEDALTQVRLDTVICLIDAYATIQYPQIGYVNAKQIESADILIINKTDCVSPDELSGIKNVLKKYNDHALTLTAVRSKINFGLILDPVVKKERPRSAQKDRHTEHEMNSFVFTSKKTFDREKFQAMITQWPENIFRAKGFIQFPDGYQSFNYVLGRQDWESFNAQETQLVFIGPRLKYEQKKIIGQIRQCEQ